MKKNVVVCFFLISVLTTAQQQNFSYTNKLISDILLDMEDKFDVRFSYKSVVLNNLKISINQDFDLKTLLSFLSKERNLEFIFLDEENIVVKSAFDPSLFNDILDEITVVTEYLTTGFDKNKQDGSITLKPNKLGILPGLTEPDILQSLQLLPGISSPEESAANLHIRGSTPDHNLILYDGIKIYHQGHLFGMIAPFNPYIIESVDVFRSGTKAEYGDRISGIIDIKSMEEIPSELTGGFGTNFLHSDAYVKVPIQKEKIGLQFSARSSINNIVKEPTLNSFRNKLFQNTIIEENNSISEEEEINIIDDAFKFIDVNSKLIFKQNEKHNISFSGLFIENTLNYKAEDEENTGESHFLDLSNKGINSDWNTILNDRINLKNTLKYSEFSSLYNSEAFEHNMQLESNTTSNTIKDFGILSQLNYRFDKKINLQVGYEFMKYNIDYNIQFIEDETITEQEKSALNIHNLFAEINVKNKKWFGRFGVRTSLYNNLNKSFLEPRVYFNYTLNPSLKLKASGEIKNQAVSQLVSFEFNDLVYNAIWALANDDDIPVLNNKQVTFGFFYQKKGWKIDIESYFKKINGLTSFTKGFASNTISEDYVSGNSEVFGVDVLIKKKIRKFRTWLSYSYSQNNFEFLELQPNKFPGNFDQTHIISWSNTYKFKKINLAFGWQFATGKPYSNPDEILDDEIVFSQQNNVRLSNYHKMDFSGFYDFYFSKQKKVKSRIGFSIINVFNRNNEIDKSFSIDVEDNQNGLIAEETNLGLGFTPNFVFRVFF